MARKALLVLTVVGLSSGTDIESDVALRLPPRWEYKGGVADLWLSGRDQPFARRPASVCRGRPVHRESDCFVEMALRSLFERTAPQRARRGKRPQQLKREY